MGLRRSTVTQAHGVTLRGTSRNTSTNASRLPPTFTIENKTGRARQVQIVSLTSVSGTQERQLTVTNHGPFALGGMATLTLRVGFTGRSLYTHRWAYQYRLELTVDSKPLTAMASTHYICRIPKRQIVP